MSHFICSNIEQRKERIRKEKQLKPRVKSILKESTLSATQLFGDKLKEEMKVLNEKATSLTHDNTGDKAVFFIEAGAATTNSKDDNKAPHTTRPTEIRRNPYTGKIKHTKRDQGRREITREIESKYRVTDIGEHERQFHCWENCITF